MRNAKKKNDLFEYFVQQNFHFKSLEPSCWAEGKDTIFFLILEQKKNVCSELACDYKMSSRNYKMSSRNYKMSSRNYYKMSSR